MAEQRFMNYRRCRNILPDKSGNLSVRPTSEDVFKTILKISQPIPNHPQSVPKHIQPMQQIMKMHILSDTNREVNTNFENVRIL